MPSVSRRAYARPAVILLCAFGGAVVPSAAEAASSQTWRLKLDARKGMQAVSTPKPLKRGAQYIATVQGTFAYYAASTWLDREPCGPFVRPMFRSPGVKNAYAGTDAEFTFALPGQEGGACASLPDPFTQFQISTGARFSHLTPIGGPPASPNRAHRYKYLLKGKAKRARFRLADTYTKDNYGVARITVRLAPKGFTAPVPPVVPVVPTPVPTP